MNKNSLIVTCVALAILVVAANFFTGGLPNAYGAPAAAPTPLSVTQPVAGATPKVVTWFNAQSITADITSPCIDLGPYNLADVYYNSDQSATNNITLTLRFGNKSSATVAGVNVLANSTTDTAALQPYELFGVCTAIAVDVANSTPVALTVDAKVQ